MLRKKLALRKTFFLRLEFIAGFTISLLIILSFLTPVVNAGFISTQYLDNAIMHTLEAETSWDQLEWFQEGLFSNPYTTTIIDDRFLYSTGENASKFDADRNNSVPFLDGQQFRLGIHYDTTSLGSPFYGLDMLADAVVVQGTFNVYDTAGQGPLFTTQLGAYQLTPVPEPGTIILLGSGIIALAGLRKKKF